MISLKSLIYSQFVTYDKMVQIVNATCENSNATIANIFIDVTSLTKSIYRYGDSLEIGSYTNFTSLLINMAIHYRDFFKRYYNTHTRIYLIHSHNMYEKNTILYPGYNKQYCQLYNHDKKLKDIVESNINLLSLLCKYLPDIFYIPSELETGVVMGLIMSNNNKVSQDEVNFIFTKDVYNFQLATSFSNTIIIRPKKNYSDNNENSDISFPIVKENFWKAYFYNAKVNSIEMGIVIDPSMVTLGMAFGGLKQRDIYRTIGIKEILKSLEKLILDNKIINGYPIDTLNIIGAISCTTKKSFDIMHIYNTFKAIDIPFQISYLKDDPAALRISSYLINSYDPDAVKKINDEYFKDEPIDLNRV